MWRARSDGDDQPSRGREPRTGEGSRSESRRGLSDWPDGSLAPDDPRSEPTGKKIRRIEASPPGSPSTDRRGDRTESGEALARRQRSVSSRDRGQEPTEIGGPPSGRPGRHIARPPSLADRAASASAAGAEGGGLGSLPPLRQPTGEQPVVPEAGASSPVQVRPSSPGPDRADPLDFPAPNGNGASGRPKGEEPTRRGTGGESSTRAGSSRAGSGRAGSGRAGSNEAGPYRTAGGPAGAFDEPRAPADRGLDRPPAAPSLPSASAGPGSPTSEAARSGRNAMPSVFDFEPELDHSVAASPPEPAAGLADGIPTSSIPSALSEAGGPSTAARDRGESSQTAAFPSWSGSMADKQRTDDQTRTMGPAARDRSSRAAAGRPGGPGGPGGRRPGTAERSGFAGGPSSPGGGGGRSSRGPSQRLQETEIKLAGRQERPNKPQEPNRVVLFLAVVLVVLAGAAAAWWLTQGDAAEDGDPVATEDTETETGDSTSTTGTVVEDTVASEPVLDVPELSLAGVEPGPLDPSVTYSIELVGETPGSMLQVVVDGVAQGQPDLLLPDLILPSGRHTLVVTVTNGADVRTSTPVEVYVLGPPPQAGMIANLASIDMVNEGWEEAIRRFDGFRDAGHQDLQLLPITAGYWNIFVPDLGQDVAAVEDYCESMGLAMPDECFAKSFDPTTYTGPVVSAPAAEAGTDETTTDQDGGETSSTTTGG